MDSNELIQHIIKSFNEKKNSHAFLFETNKLDKCLNDTISIIKSINCKEKKENCTCNICNTIENNNNPDVIIVKPDGKEIKKDQILNIINTFSTKPLICDYSIYVVLEADKMNISSANKILKFLEEPEENIIGFFITENIQKIIPTIRSRCELLKFNYESNNILDYLEITEEEYGIVYDKAFNFLNILNDNVKFNLMIEAKDISKYERDELELFFKVLKKFYIFKYEYLMYNRYYNLDFIKNIVDAIMCNDINLIVKRIKILDNSINDLVINVNKELFINNFILMWE